MSTPAFDPKSDVLDRLGFALQLFRADLAALPDSALARTGGGESRSAYDFMFELSGFFDAFAGLLETGPSPIEGPQGGWVRAPADWQDRERAMASLAAASDRFIAALRSYGGEFTSDVFPSPVGPFTPLGMANLAVWHTMYHSGQVNYIQTILGDVDFHWVPSEAIS